jgi:hypothetical protein
MAILPRQGQGCPTRLCSCQPIFESVYPTSAQGECRTWFRSSSESSFFPLEAVADQQIHKLYIVVELLTGVIPDRAMFRRPVLKNALAPYFQVVQGTSHHLYEALR